TSGPATEIPAKSLARRSHPGREPGSFGSAARRPIRDGWRPAVTPTAASPRPIALGGRGPSPSKSQPASSAASPDSGSRRGEALAREVPQRSSSESIAASSTSLPSRPTPATAAPQSRSYAPNASCILHGQAGTDKIRHLHQQYPIRL